MIHPRLRPLGIALTLVLALAAAAPAAARPAGHGAARPARPQAGLLDLAWDWLARTAGLPGAPGLARAWAGDYGGIDPNGGAKTNGTAPLPPATAGLDPAGQP